MASRVTTEWLSPDGSNAGIRLRLLSFGLSKHRRCQQPVHPPSRASQNAGAKDCAEQSTRRCIIAFRMRTVGVVKRTLRKPRLLRNSIILLPMVVAVQAKRNMLWFQKRNFEFRNSLKIAEGCGTRHAAAQAHLFKLSYHDFRALSLLWRRESARPWRHSVVSRNTTSSHPRIVLALRPRRLC